MTRTLTTVQRASLGLESGVALVAFLELNFGGGTIRLATAPVDLSWNGVTWQGIGGRLVIEPPREAPGDDRSQSLRLELSGVDQAILAVLLQQEYIGRTIRAWYAHVALGTNLTDNSGFETDLLGVVATGATITRSQAVPPFAGDYVLSVAMTVSAADQGITAFDRKDGTWQPVTGGQSYVYEVLAQMNAGSGARQIKAEIDFYASTGGANVGGGQSTTINLGPGLGWTKFQVLATAPATATVCRLRLRSVSATGLYTIYVDAVRLYPGAKEQPYQITDGAPIQGGTILTDPIRLGSWFMNGGFEIEESAEFEQLTCSISCRVTSRLAALTNRRGIKTNLESHGRLFLGDKFFEHVPALASADILWGNVAGWVNRFRRTGGTPPHPVTGLGPHGGGPRRP